MKRIFIAINLPAEIKEELGRVQAEIRESFEDDGVGKWVEQANLHITLLFLGEVDDDKVGKIEEIIKEIPIESFKIRFEKVCYGAKSGGVPRLIWVKVGENEQLKKLAGDLQERIFRAGVLRQRDNRPFAGHITLARIKAWIWKRIEPEERPDVERELDLEFTVSSVDIMESKLRREGPEYSILFKREL